MPQGRRRHKKESRSEIRTAKNRKLISCIRGEFDQRDSLNSTESAQKHTPPVKRNLIKDNVDRKIIRAIVENRGNEKEISVLSYEKKRVKPEDLPQFLFRKQYDGESNEHYDYERQDAYAVFVGLHTEGEVFLRNSILPQANPLHVDYAATNYDKPAKIKRRKIPIDLISEEIRETFESLVIGIEESTRGQVTQILQQSRTGRDKSTGRFVRIGGLMKIVDGKLVDTTSRFKSIYDKSGQATTSVALFNEGWSIRRVSKATGACKVTAHSYMKQLVGAKCKCGKLLRNHRGWCKHRYDQYPNRKAYWQKHLEKQKREREFIRRLVENPIILEKELDAILASIQ